MARLARCFQKQWTPWNFDSCVVLCFSKIPGKSVRIFVPVWQSMTGWQHPPHVRLTFAVPITTYFIFWPCISQPEIHIMPSLNCSRISFPLAAELPVMSCLDFACSWLMLFLSFLSQPLNVLSQATCVIRVGREAMARSLCHEIGKLLWFPEHTWATLFPTEE